jgi:hypothetical protein
MPLLVCGVLCVKLGLLNQFYIHTGMLLSDASFINIFKISREPLSLLSKPLNVSHSQQFYALLR